MPYARTSLRSEQRTRRDEMRALGLSRRQIAAEFARRYQLRSRAAWRTAHGWSLRDAAERINSFAAGTGLTPDGATVAMTGAHLCEYEAWPGHAPRPTGRRPTPYLLSLLACVYGCGVTDLLDLADYEHMPPADRLILDKTAAAGGQEGHDPAASQVSGWLERSQRSPPVSGISVPSSTAADYQAGAGDGTTLHGEMTTAYRKQASPDPLRVPDHSGLVRLAIQASWPGARLSRPLRDWGVDWHLELPAGRMVEGGGGLALQVHPLAKAADGSAFLPVVGGVRLDQFMATTHRGMLIGIDEQAQPARIRALDLREARRTIIRSPGAPSALVIPEAYELDDITYGIIWAVASLDDALLADDHLLDERHRELRGYEQLSHSAVGRHAAGDLTSASRMWLGSSFCARHILRNLTAPGQLPVFWTREQNGEEGSAWLLFRHKYDYLKRIGDRFAGTVDPLIRGFCIPETAVATSPRWERILLWLSIALMESLGICVKICTEPEYADAEGFVLLPGERAIIATWVRADGIWNVDAATSPSVIRGFGEVAGHVTAHSVTDAGTPGRRLVVLADYLGLDWAWLWRRCAGLGEYGCAGLIQPRSRLLAVDGLDAALRYAGVLGREGGQ